MIPALPHLRDRTDGPLRFLVALAVLSLALSLAASSFSALAGSSDGAGDRRFSTAPATAPEPTTAGRPLDDGSDHGPLPAPGAGSQNATFETADDAKDPVLAVFSGGFGLLVGPRDHGTEISPGPAVRWDSPKISRGLLSRPPPAR